MLKCMVSPYDWIRKQVGTGYGEEDKVLLRILGGNDHKLTINGIEFTAACVEQVQNTKGKYLGELNDRLYVEQGDICQTEYLPEGTNALSCSFCEYFVVSIAVLILASRCPSLRVMLMDEEVFKYLQQAFTYSVKTKTSKASCNKAVVAKFCSYTLDDTILNKGSTLTEMEKVDTLLKVINDWDMGEVEQEHERMHIVVNMEVLHEKANGVYIECERRDSDDNNDNNDSDKNCQNLKRNALRLQRETKPLTLVLLIAANRKLDDTASRLVLKKKCVGEKKWQFYILPDNIRRDMFTSALLQIAVQVEILDLTNQQKAEQLAMVCSICVDSCSVLLQHSFL